LLVGGILFALRRFARQRAPIGRKAKRYLEGFILYLQTAEVDRFEVMQTPDTIEQTARGVELYRTYLPYAIALGLENDWTKKFGGSYTESPAWIVGNALASAGDLQRSVIVALRHS
jgi:hypothetical protein